MTPITLDERKTIPAHLRRKREWDSRDFAEFLGVSHWQARERLKTYDRAMSGMLLDRSRGANRRYSFHPAKLAKVFPAIFDEIEGLSVRQDDADEKLSDLFDRQRMLAMQVADMTEAVGRLQRKRKAA